MLVTIVVHRYDMLIVLVIIFLPCIKPSDILMKLYSYLSPCLKINSKWIKDFTVKLQVLKLLGENIDNTLQDISIGKDLLNSTVFPQKFKAINDK